jgi:predicted nucleic acid-binding protein
MTPKTKAIGILPDSSVWIDHLNFINNSKQVDILRHLLKDSAPLWTCPPVYQEVLQGISNQKVFEQTRKQFCQYRHGKIGIMQASDFAIEIFRTLRKHGLTIRKPNDCLIAAYALLNDLALLHRDRDFDPIEEYFGLKVIHCQRQD